MIDIRTSLLGKLNPLGYKSLEGAVTFCRLRGNKHVELVHLFNQILQLQDSDLHRIIQHFELDRSRLDKGVTDSLDALQGGATSVSALSEYLLDTVEKAWVMATLHYGETQVRTGHLLVAMLQDPGSAAQLASLSAEFKKVKEEALAEDFDAILAASPEAGLGAQDGSSVAAAGGSAAPGPAGAGDALGRFTVDLTEEARSGGMDPIVGRDEEIRQIVDILMRRRQNNPLLTGEAGVGKTAVVEGFAQRIAAGDVPPPMRDVQLLSLDLGLLQAGASMKGEFEERLRNVIEEVQSSEKPIILFVDEAHTLMGAGGAAGTGDAANLLKPALARGDLRTVAATTWAEYKKHIEKDPALTRRFQVIQVGEPSEEKGVLMMRGIASMMEAHHKVQIEDEALQAAVSLSHRYIPARQLPDKAVSLLDTAAARVAISQHAVPAAVEDCRRQIEALEREQAIIERERSVGLDVDERAEECRQQLQAERERLAGLERDWEVERSAVTEILGLRETLRGELDEANRSSTLEELRSKQAVLKDQQGESPLILSSVDHQAVASVIADWTGIPVGRMAKNQVSTVLKLAQLMAERVVGQDHAMDIIAKRVQTSRASLDNPSKPIGVFMLAGPSGVGKTETALTLAEALYGGEQNLITINMSEFQEAHTVSTLKGAPPGYVGYGEGGVLTEAVRRRPYSVVLLDEIEKAHRDVHEIFFQVFDKGRMEDGEGRSIDFKNTLIILTTNVGTDLVMDMCRDPELMPDSEGLAKALREPLLKVFPAALLGRLVVVPYYPLSDEVISLIIRLQLGRIEKRVVENHNLPFSYDDEVVRVIASRCTELESGGRMIDAILTNTVLPAISTEFLTRMLEGHPPTKLHIGVDQGEFRYDFD